MHKHSRREFLAHSAVAGGMVALGGQSLFAAEKTPAKPVNMTIARWAGAKPTEEDMKQIAVKLTEKAIEGLGGLKRFVSRGDVVWVKPNIGWERNPRQAANTNPDVVATLVRLCLEAGAKTVKVGDNPCGLPAKCYESQRHRSGREEGRRRNRVRGPQPFPRHEHRRRTPEDAPGLS